MLVLLGELNQWGNTIIIIIIIITKRRGKNINNKIMQ
jgi:hypothetical protein